MSKFGSHVLVQIVLVIAIGSLAGFLAIITAGALGGMAIGVAPEPTFRLVGGLVCGGGAELEFGAIQRSYHEPGEYEPQLECVSSDNTRHDVLLPAIFAVLGIAFLAVFAVVFVPVFVPFSILAIVLTARVMASPGTDDSAA